MRIYTKKGDKGSTSLFGGKRLAKDAVRIEAYGTVDELNAQVGVLLDNLENADIQDDLLRVQHWLFDYGSMLATPPGAKLYVTPPGEKALSFLEEKIDAMELELPPLKHFILPSGHTSTSFAHMARCVCRRAERRIVSLSHEEEIGEEPLAFFNRLSDYFFVLARYLTHLAGKKDVEWNPRD
ncbi:MAG TPA: cob(I)yrinic acid a,c-diamide adenosyltransferase [Saprospiraceae bacterium]|jgi:cob(I)alamin adenosyltransferase|nr:MAG: ATP/cobalamin adenosyltransferase [Candidatus Parvibacillus calidus]MCC7150080.1 cob(I)yrinic acid a,c-diamide adenosyltransferase [Saprospiraceae bacterium]WKZ63043.1 MAG: cob(I)yrinic acid a,c-diamide adenosyltransferase [Saprospiraceae bacterium]HPB53129.1 cob(I)yrinic acid a,c-diamide adenosyltransferase [Saprospiraceae bacterium]HRN34941.1 cob(I)yrinic acid a,c-diamide adenosyltransferase [Saprospiraceae bacterium]